MVCSQQHKFAHQLLFTFVLNKGNSCVNIKELKYKKNYIDSFPGWQTENIDKFNPAYNGVAFKNVKLGIIFKQNKPYIPSSFFYMQ